MTLRWIASTHRTALLGALGIGLGLLCGCPPKEEPPETCPDSVFFFIDPSATGEHYDRRGSIKLLERHYADGSTSTTVVGAKFGDFALSTAESQGGLAMSDACIGLSGQPVRSDKHCEYTTTTCEDNSDCQSGVDCREYDRLDVAGVRVEGLAGGAIDLQHPGFGTFTMAGLSQLFGDSLIKISVIAATGSAEHQFVSSDGDLMDIPPPRFVQGVTPAIDGTISIGREDLILKWDPAGNPDELVYIDVIATQTSTITAGQTRNVGLSCVALDQPTLEGKACQTLWGNALLWLMTPEDGWMIGDNVTIMIGRRSAMGEDLTDYAPNTGLRTGLGAELTAEVQGKMLP